MKKSQAELKKTITLTLVIEIAVFVISSLVLAFFLVIGLACYLDADSISQFPLVVIVPICIFSVISFGFYKSIKLSIEVIKITECLIQRY